MRLGLVCALLIAVAGCKAKGGEKKAEAGEQQDDGSAAAAADLLARRDALMKSRNELAEKKKALEIERTKIIEAGGDTTEIDKQAEELRAEEEKINNDETSVSGEMSALLEGVKSVQATGDALERASQREVIAKEREKQAAEREKAVAMREKDIAEREKALLLLREKECSAGGGGTTIIQTVDPKGAKYSKKDVESALKKAREAMSKKAILSSDLPSQAAGLEKEATKSMADGDYGPARFAAQQLLATVEGIKIDRTFISGKITRLSAAMKGRTLDDKKQKEVDDLFREATAKYGDGDYSGANKKLNAIWRAID